MKQGLSLTAVGHATSLFLAITFTLCIAFGLIFPSHVMLPIWQGLLPGFEWISWRSFLLGLAEIYLYGWYITLVWVPVYNVLALRKARS